MSAYQRFNQKPTEIVDPDTTTNTRFNNSSGNKMYTDVQQLTQRLNDLESKFEELSKSCPHNPQQPQMTPTQPQMTPTQPQMTPTQQPQMTHVQQPQMTPTQPQMTPTQPQMTQPQMTHVQQPQMTPTQNATYISQ